ncbi:MAG: hypothetical protein LCH61_04050 [Proteobacteria bacterium]|nr:hypothetical protein [Pseudomonadota bacterium]
MLETTHSMRHLPDGAAGSVDVAAQRSQPARGDVTDRLHPAIIKIMVGCFVVMMVVFWLTLKASGEALFSIVISSFYLLMYCGAPWIMGRTGSKHGVDRGQARDLNEFLGSHMITATGELTGWEVLIQVCSIAASLMIATIGICIVIYLT